MVLDLRTTMSCAASLPVARSTIRGIRMKIIGAAKERIDH